MNHVVTTIKTALAIGPMGETIRPTDYQAFISCGLDADGGKLLSTIKTSCGVFARAVLHRAGHLATHPWRVGWPMFHGWLADLDMNHPAWVNARSGADPEPGDLFFIQSELHPNNVHVGFFIEPEGLGWATAEGGGGDGSRCALGGKPRVIGAHFDAGRTLRGWWSARLLGLVDDTDPKRLDNAAEKVDA